MNRPSRGRALRACAPLVALAAALGFAAPASAAWTTSNQHQLVPAYLYPDWYVTPSNWYRMCDAMNTRGGASIAVMNPNSGPGTAANSDYQRVIDYCHARGQQIVSYVHTSYGSRSVATVKAEIDASYAYYPSIDGIFLDEMSNSTGTRAYYQQLYAYIKAKTGARQVIGNPGVAASSSWQLDTPVADVVIVFEGTASSYLRWTAPTWAQRKAASQLSHLVYSAASTSTMQQVCSRSERQNGGWMYVTNDVLPNPWDTLPAGNYWTSEVAAC